MGKSTVRFFCSLGILISSLCFTKGLALGLPPSGISRHVPVISLMQNDRELCPMPKYVYENDIIGKCRNVTYSESRLPTDSKLKDTFLCTAFYDTWFKYCKREQSRTLFNDTASFLTYIHKFFPGEGGSDSNAFCDNIKGIKFSYEELKEPLSSVNLNLTNVCYPMCFEITGDFLPLCGILAWSKSIDDETKQTPKTGEPDKIRAPENQPAHQQAKVPSALADKKSEEKEQGIDDDNTIENAKANVDSADTAAENTEKSKAKPVNEADKIMKASIEKPESETALKTKIVNDDKSTPSNQQVPNDEKEETVKKLAKDETKTETQNEGENANSNVNTGMKVTENDDTEANKKEIISPNTDDHDDHDNSIGQDDWSHGEEDRLPNDPNDDQSILPAPADQSQSVPEPSERRDIISGYHSIRTDEDSHFFTYFTIVSLVSIAAYIGYHNKQKILAIVLEGRRSRNSRGRRRPSTANYRKLDCTLEEAVTSQCDANVTHVIY